MTDTLSDTDTFFYRQLTEWELAETNYEALKYVETKKFLYNGLSIKVQYNPKRIQSSGAQVDNVSIKKRACFLCAANRPHQQNVIHIDQHYELLVNPYPIFPIHFTIPSNTHTEQLISGKFKDLLILSFKMDKYTLFYNGPKCGASAPDHFHFQAGNKMYLPLHYEIESGTASKKSIYDSGTLRVYVFENYLRNGFLIQGENLSETEHFFYHLIDCMEVKPGEKEPMINIFTWYKTGTWYCCIFPREKHRPACYYAEGDENMLISPGAVDMGGIIIVPLKKDFDKIQFGDIQAIFEDVCINENKLHAIIDRLSLNA